MFELTGPDADPGTLDETDSGAEHRPRAGFERHGFKPVPFVFGVAFAAIAIGWSAGFSSEQATAWLWVVALIVVGGAGIVAALNRRS